MASENTEPIISSPTCAFLFHSCLVSKCFVSLYNLKSVFFSYYFPYYLFLYKPLSLQFLKKKTFLFTAHTSRTLRYPSELRSPFHPCPSKRPAHGGCQLQSDAAWILHIRSVFKAPVTLTSSKTFNNGVVNRIHHHTCSADESCSSPKTLRNHRLHLSN